MPTNTIKQVFHLYLDESGSRDPSQSKAENDPEWFGFGGVLVSEEKRIEVVRNFKKFYSDHDVRDPLHSVEIRSRTKKFRWLGNLSKRERDDFFADLSTTILSSPVLVHGCIINRERYRELFSQYPKEKRWRLCKSAFAIVVERAAKFAQSHGAHLVVHAEKCSKKEDRRVQTYLDEIFASGGPFKPETSRKFKPLATSEFREIVSPKIIWHSKKDILTQLADLVLFPICLNPYKGGNYGPYQDLLKHGLIVDQHVGSRDDMKIKYYCFGYSESKKGSHAIPKAGPHQEDHTG